jgi:hypothetical protein
MRFTPQECVRLQSVPNACATIDSITDAYDQYLATIIQQDLALRNIYTHAHNFLAGALTAAPETTSVRQTVFDFYVALSGGHSWYQKDWLYDVSRCSGLAWLRERASRTLEDALTLSVPVKSQIASALHLEAGYDLLWNDFSVLALDNHNLHPLQRDFLHRYLSCLPAGIHDLRAIAATELLGSTTPSVALDGAGGDINISPVRIGDANDNPFPAEVAGRDVDRFSMGVAHEVNRAVDAYTVSRNNRLHSREGALLGVAGSQHLNYLRSSFPDGYFTSDPAEFFPCIADQWFADTRQTLNLAIVRHQAGRSAPANQFLWCADVYSLGGDSTSFYTMDTQGGIVRERIPLWRDGGGNITRMVVDNVTYDFTLDPQGNVIDIALPIQLAYIKATAMEGGGVRLTWKTVSEINNYGFEVQCAAVPPAYTTLPGSFVPGHGTSAEPHEYAWTGNGADPSSYYRLKQTDLDGTGHYTEGIRPESPQNVGKERIPVDYVLEQNFPNPANPTTVIRYGIPRAAHVALTVFSALGQQVAVCVDRDQDAGYHEVRFDVRNLASGMYFYTLRADSYVRTMRLLVLK